MTSEPIESQQQPSEPKQEHRPTIKVWVDADACPKVIKELLFVTADRRPIELTLVANHGMAIPKRSNIQLRLVAQGFDQADNALVDWASAGDLVLTNDIPLAADLVAKGVAVLGFRGQSYNAQNIAEQLSRRNLMQELRELNMVQSGGSAFSAKDKQQFANAFDAWLTRALRALPNNAPAN